MAGRGRKSPEARAAALLPGERLPPPDSLAEPERATWLKITGAMPGDWFSPSNAPLLVQYVRHVHSADLIAQDITRLRAEIADARANESLATEPKAIARARQSRLALEKILLRTLRSHGYEGDRVMRLSQKLRLSQLSRYTRADAAAAATAKATLRPWLDWANGPRQ